MYGATTFGKGQSAPVTTVTDAGPQFQGVDPKFMYDVMRRLIQYRSQAQPKSQYGATPLGAASAPAFHAPPTPRGESPYDPLAGLRQEAEVAKLKAISEPLPTRLTNFNSANVINGLVRDPLKMTGAQLAMTDGRYLGLG
jgi:hypothetical protein